MVKYKLVNPYIKGNIKTTFDKKTQAEAARAAWKTISKHITNIVPKFAFTLQSGSGNSKDLYHYVVKETVHNDMVDYTIKKLNIKKNSKATKQFEKSLNKFKNKMTGGGSNDDDDDGVDTFTFLRNIYTSVPILWYHPQIYRFGNVLLPMWYMQDIVYIIDVPIVYI